MPTTGAATIRGVTPVCSTWPPIVATSNSPFASVVKEATIPTIP
jgi:hypothetical protein